MGCVRVRRISERGVCKHTCSTCTRIYMVHDSDTEHMSQQTVCTKIGQSNTRTHVRRAQPGSLQRSTRAHACPQICCSAAPARLSTRVFVWCSSCCCWARSGYCCFQRLQRTIVPSEVAICAKLHLYLHLHLTQQLQLWCATVRLHPLLPPIVLVAGRVRRDGCS